MEDGKIIKFNGKEIFYQEYGAGAFITRSKKVILSGQREDCNIIADFYNHLDAEKFLDMCKKEKQ